MTTLYSPGTMVRARDRDWIVLPESTADVVRVRPADGRPEEVEVSAALLAEGRADGLELAGLGARDSLRLEAGYPLYGHELSLDISPIAAGLGWTVKLDKGADFAGRAALLAGGGGGVGGGGSGGP
jgi:glycine cleavage system aminomethyltransferase T